MEGRRKELYGRHEEKVEEIKENYVSNKSFFFPNRIRYISGPKRGEREGCRGSGRNITVGDRNV